MRNTQIFCDLAQVSFRTRFIFHHARAADHFQVGNLGEIGEDFVLHASGEKGVFFVLAQIFKWEDGNALVGNWKSSNR